MQIENILYNIFQNVGVNKGAMNNCRKLMGENTDLLKAEPFRVRSEHNTLLHTGNICPAEQSLTDNLQIETELK